MALHFELVTPEQLIRSDDAYMVVLPGEAGELGIMAGHAPLVTVLKAGGVRIHAGPGGATETLRISGGFAEVNAKGLTILADGLDEAPGL